MGAGQPLDALLGEDRVEESAGAAVGIRDEDPLVALPPALANPRPDAGRDAAGPVVKLGRQARDVDVRQRPSQLDQFTRERPAANDQDARGLRQAAARRSSMSRRAVSAATPASRQ